MLDHVFLDAIAALQGGLAGALLERRTYEERFRVDLLLGDVSWETSYSLPGDSGPPDIRADVMCDWPTWSQTAYRSWTLGEEPSESPEVGIEVVFRMEHIEGDPDIGMIAEVVPARSASIGPHWLVRGPPVVSHLYTEALDLQDRSVEICYEGTYRIPAPALEKVPVLSGHFVAMGTWIASTLVRLSDLNLAPS